MTEDQFNALTDETRKEIGYHIARKLCELPQDADNLESLILGSLTGIFLLVKGVLPTKHCEEVLKDVQERLAPWAWDSAEEILQSRIESAKQALQ